MNTLTFKAKQVRNDIPLKNNTPFKEGVTTVLAMFGIFAVIMTLDYYILGILFLIVAYSFLKRIFTYLRIKYPDWAKESDFRGSLLFREEKIGDIYTDDISSIVILFNKQRDKKLSYSHEPMYNGLLCFEILLKDGREKKYVILIEEKEQFNELGAVLKAYYKQKIKIEEKYTGDPEQGIERTFLFKKHYLHAEKQELKAELQMEKFPIWIECIKNWGPQFHNWCRSL